MQEPDPILESGSEKLCQACGLCCRGVWFSHVPLDHDEIEPASKVGIKVVFRGAEAGFNQPCAMHKENRCSIYGVWRPKVCVSYSCALLDDYLAGDTPFTTALSHVRAARVMADRIQAETGVTVADGGLATKKFLFQVEDSTVEGSNALSPSGRADAVALSVYYDRFFKKPSLGEKSSGTEALTPSRNSE